MFWRFFSGLSDCTGVVVAVGGVTGCGGGTMISGRRTKGIGWVAGRSSLSSRLLGSEIGGGGAGSGSRTGSSAGDSER